MTPDAPGPGPDPDPGPGPRFTDAVLTPLKRSLVGRDEAVDVLGVGLAAGTNTLLLGPPGTAKSALVRGLAGRLGGETFEVLLTRFTEPNELFGPFDLRRLREGELVTNTAGMLPEADLLFLDELFNANSAVLNALLAVLNERVFRRGAEARPLPTLLAVAATNHLPEDPALAALYDRFPLRVACGPVADADLEAVLERGWALEAAPPASGEAAFPLADARLLQAAAAAVDVAPVRAALAGLVRHARRAGVEVSDRRAVKLLRPVAASAALAGRTTADASDLWVLAHAWERPEQAEALRSLVARATEGADSPAPHPRAQGDAPPDPEALAAAIDAVREKGGPAAADRLDPLADRVAWVPPGPQRDALDARLAAARERLAEAEA